MRPFQAGTAELWTVGLFGARIIGEAHKGLHLEMISPEYPNDISFWDGGDIGNTEVVVEYRLFGLYTVRTPLWGP